MDLPEAIKLYTGQTPPNGYIPDSLLWQAATAAGYWRAQGPPATGAILHELHSRRWSQQEISRRTGIPVSTVNRLIERHRGAVNETE